MIADARRRGQQRPQRIDRGRSQRRHLQPARFGGVRGENARAARIGHDRQPASGWQRFAGRLAYTQYGLFKRLILRHIAKKEGASTDTRQDQELTDWTAVDRFTDLMAREIQETERRTVRGAR